MMSQLVRFVGKSKPVWSLAAHAVKNGEADAMLSAGNTGALLASGYFIVGRIKVIDRPGLMSTLPTLDGEGLWICWIWGKC